MKKSAYIIFLLTVALVGLTYKLATVAPEHSRSDEVNVAIENIMTRASVRAYSARPLAKETLDTLLQAAMAAPTAVNMQPWRIVVVSDSAIRNKIGDEIQSMAMAKDAQASIVLCGDMGATLPGDGKDFWVQDVSAASENLLLAVNAVGLGAVWCGIYPIPERVEFFSQLLELPDSVVPMSCINVGYPAAPATPKDKWDTSKIHYNKY